MDEKVSISFLGDISFNDNYIRYYEDGINPFSVFGEKLANQDYVIGNLECLAKGDSGENELKKPRLTTTVETLGFLKMINVNIVSLAQNHVYDHLESGFTKTINFLDQNQIMYLGASLISDQAEAPLVIQKNDIKLGLINFVTSDTYPNLPKDAKVNLNIFELGKAIDSIKKIRAQVNHVVVLLHWGGIVEGGLFPDYQQPLTARKLIDAGADIIIGHHSHTLQPYEVYKGKYIFYSLGNFCFSDYIFEGKYNPMPFRRRISTIVPVTFNKEGYHVHPLNVYLNQEVLFTEINYTRTLKIRNDIFQLLRRIRLLWCVYYFHKKYILPAILFFSRGDISFISKIRRLYNSIKKRFVLKRRGN